MNSMDLRTDVPPSARIYDFLLGGKDNFQVDRDAATAITASWPNLATSMRANRTFMARVVRYLAADRGMRQFLDISTGLPTAPNLHEVVQGVAPESRVVYVDNGHIESGCAHTAHRRLPHARRFVATAVRHGWVTPPLTGVDFAELQQALFRFLYRQDATRAGRAAAAL